MPACFAKIGVADLDEQGKATNGGGNEGGPDGEPNQTKR